MTAIISGEVSIIQVEQSFGARLARAIEETLLAPAQRLFRFPTSAAGGEFAKLLWLLRLRWGVIALLLLGAGPALLLKALSRETVPVYLGMIGLMLIFNLFSHVTLSERSISPLRVCFHLGFDLFALTVLLAITDGVANPFTALFFLNVALGGLLIQGSLSFPFLLLAHAFLLFLQLRFAFRNSFTLDGALFVSFATSHILLAGFWLVMRSLGAQMERQFERETRARMLLEKQDRLRGIGALAAGFSHEFASPLNAARIRLDRLRRSSSSEDLTEALAAIEACENVVRQMNSSQLDLRESMFREVEVADLLRDVIDSWRDANPSTPVELRVENGGRALLPPVNFAQVILNLLDNAAEAAPGLPVEVSLRESRNTEFEILVADGGPGFPAEVRARFGEPFVTTKPAGTGLGLYVSLLFGQSLGGSLSLEDREGRGGAVVRLRWPRRREPR